MKKSLPFLVCLLLILFGKTFLSAQDVKWAIRVGGSGTEIGFNIAVDSSKRTYAAQQIISGTSVNFNGSCTITGGSNSYDVSFVRLDTVGACISSKYIITQNDNVMGLRLDSLNNIYIVGNRSGTNSLCTSQATSGQDILLAKLSSTGTCTWGKKIGGSSGDYGYRLSLDRDGNIYITGSFAGTVSFDGISLVSGGSNDGFIAKFNNSGTIQWAKKFGSTGDDFGYGISNVVNGNFYVCGRVQNTGTFGTLSAVSKGGYDAFIAKVDASNGSFVWLRTAGVSGAANENGIQVVMDPSGNALYTVLVSGGAIFGTDTIPYRCEAVVMYNSDGDIQWTRPMGSAAGYIGPSVAIHDSTIYFAGALGATTYIGPFTATTAGGADILLAALDYSGKPLWVKTYGSTASDYAMEIACDQEGDLYVTGVFSGTVNFGGISRTSSGSNDVYYFKATPPLLITKVAEGKNMVCGTGAFDVAYRTGTIFDTTNVFTVELSDTAGNFSQPVPVGTLNATTSGTITATIPDTIPAGSSYRLRITSSNPATTGAEYATNFRLSPIPSTPTPPTPQTSCSDTTVLFVFDSILAGSGGHQIEWALSSLFDTTEIIESNGSINLLVESGAMDTLWMRSRDSITGCVSGIVWTTGRVNAVPDQPTTSELLTSLEDTVAIFSFDTVEAGSGGDKIEWSLISDYSSSTTETSPATLAIDVNSGGNKTIYIRTDNEITGCNSESIMFIVMNGVQYGNDSSTNAPPTFFSVKSQMEAYMEANPVEEPEEDGPENNYLKWKWFWEPRHNPQNGRLDAAAAALIAYGSNPGNYCDTSSAFPSNWQSMGPSDDAEHRGRVNQIWIEPGDSSHLIVGTTGGVWELNGNTWTCMTDNGGIPSTAISALAVNPTSGNQGDIRVGLGSASQSNDDHHQWTHGYGLGVAIRDKTSHEWSIDEGFRNHYYAMDSNWLPIVSSAVFKPGSQDFYVSAGRYIFRKLAGQSNYETVYTDFFPFAKIGQITFSKTDSSKALATATGPITKLLRSTEGGKSGSWVDISNHVFKGTDFNTTFGTYPDTNWGTWNNVGNGVNWKVVSVPISVNNMAARVVSTSQDSTATLVSEFPGGSMQPNSYWSISFDAAIPANVQLRIRLCQDTGQIYNTSYFPHEIAFDVVSSNRLLAKYGFSFTNPTNTFYRFIGIDAYLPGSTTPLIIDNITLRSLSSATYFYDIVKDHTTGNPTSGHEIAYIAVKDMNHVVTLVKYDLDNLSHPVIWSKPAIALRTDVKVQVPEYNHNRIYLAGSQDWVYKTDSSQLSSLSFNLTASSHIDIRSLELIDEYGNELYVGNDGGISKLSNGGSVIQNYNKSGFATNLTFGFSSSEAIKSRVLAGNVDNATLCLDGSGNWVNVPPVYDSYETAIDREDGDNGWTQLGGGDGESFLYSTNDVLTGFPPQRNPNQPDATNYTRQIFIKQMFYHPWTNKLLCGTNDIQVYNESNDTWAKLNANQGQAGTYDFREAGLPGDVEKGGITAMWVGKNLKDDIQYVISNTSLIYRHWQDISDNNTWKWSSIGTLKTYGNDSAISNFTQGQYWAKYRYHLPMCVTADPDNPLHVWVGFGGMKGWHPDDPLANSGDQRIFRSDDGGEHWTDCSAGLPPFPVTKIVYQDGTDDILYAATDIGVYAWDKNFENDSGPNGRWVCFHENLPNVVITDMEIVQCENKIRVSTWGRGIWETALPPVPEAQRRELLIEENTTWSHTRMVATTIRIQSDAALIINNRATILMAPGTSIIVEPGGKLMVDSGKITSGCGETWDGIIVKGDMASHAQNLSTTNNATAMSNQGFVYLFGATIENAYEALRVWNPAVGWVSGDHNIGGTGGIVRAVNTTFKNNRRSAEFMWYRNTNDAANKSHFYNCRFETDAAHTPVYPFSAHVTMWGVNGITFKGCTFENQNTQSDSMQDKVLGVGIRAIDAGFKVLDFGSQRSEFKNFKEGIYISSLTSPYKTEVIHAEFESCIRGIRNEGVNACRFIDNSFAIGNLAQITNYPPGGIAGTNEGIVLHQCTGFEVEGNTFNKATASPYPPIGIRAASTGDNNNLINDNTFSGLFIGNLANGVNQNKNEDEETGLIYLCNINASNIPGYDFCVVNRPIAAGGGINQKQGNHSFPANNEFSDCSPNCNSFRHFYNDTLAVDVTYYHFNQAIPNNLLYPTYRTAIPKFRTQQVVLPQNPNICLSQSPFCPYCITIDDFRDAFVTHKWSLHDYLQQYIGLIDDGDTPYVLDEIENATNGPTLKTYLDGIAPNLSRQALEVSVQRMLLLSEAGVYEVLRDNAESVDDSIIAHFIYKYYELNPEGAMPEWMVDTIRMRMDSSTLRSYLLDTISYHSQAKDQTAFRVLNLILDDTTGLDLSIYRNWLDSLGGEWSRYEKVKTYLHEGRLDTIVQLLDSMQTNLTSLNDSLNYGNYRDALTSYIDLIEEDSSVMKLASAHIETLNERAMENEHLRGSMYARNLLNFFYDSTYFTPPYLPENAPGWSGKRGSEPDEVRKSVEPGKKFKTLPVLKIYPNPAKEFVIVEYEGFEEGGTVQVMDVYGRLLSVIHTKAENEKVEINTSGFNSGIYLVSVMVDRTMKDKGKFNIVK